MTLEQIKQRYPDEWVLIEFTQLDDELRVVNGKVIAHSPSKYEIDRILSTLRNERIAIEYTGGGDGRAYLISAIVERINDADRSKVQQPRA